MVFIENVSQTLFSFFIASQKEMYQSKNAQRKNLVHILKGHSKVTNSNSAIWACGGHKMKGSDSVFKVTRIQILWKCHDIKVL